MNVFYCDNCAVQVSDAQLREGKAVRKNNQQLYCHNCAPLFEYNTTALNRVSDVLREVSALQGKTKDDGFWFCETCGTRVSSRDLEARKGRDKRMRGVYCAGCAESVTTIEFPALAGPARKTENVPGKAIEQHELATKNTAADTAAKPTSKYVRKRASSKQIIFAPAFLFVLAAAGLFFALRPNRQNALKQGETHEQVGSQKVLESEIPKPDSASTTSNSLAKNQNDGASDVSANPRPGASIQQVEDEALHAFDSIDLKLPDPAKEQLLMSFVKKYPDTLAGARARVLLDELDPMSVSKKREVTKGAVLKSRRTGTGVDASAKFEMLPQPDGPNIIFKEDFTATAIGYAGTRIEIDGNTVLRLEKYGNGKRCELATWGLGKRKFSFTVTDKLHLSFRCNPGDSDAINVRLISAASRDHFVENIKVRKNTWNEVDFPLVGLTTEGGKTKLIPGMVVHALIVSDNSTTESFVDDICIFIDNTH